MTTNRSRIHLFWNRTQATESFRSGVCLHGHTNHSRESLKMIPYYALRIPVFREMVKKEMARYAVANGHDLDFGRAFWTPPLSPLQAFRAESRQIVDDLSLEPIVSLSDHDDIEASLELRSHAAGADQPISFEWTVPYGPQFSHYFHLGIHNLPARKARAIFDDLNAYTRQPQKHSLQERLEALDADPSILIVLNHPLWNQTNVADCEHLSFLDHFLSRCGRWIHAIELNGLRAWKENQGVIKLARDRSFTLVSGGDRHGCEPGAVLNLTRSESFSEFVEEVRGDGFSELLVMPQYQLPIRLRQMQTIWDSLRTYPSHQDDRREWVDRIYWIDQDGAERRLSQYWPRGGPWLSKAFVGFMLSLERPLLRPALHRMLQDGREIRSSAEWFSLEALPLATKPRRRWTFRRSAA